ncbi:MAG: phosphatase PAP2 family protein [Chloroflexi bacterium]|nr:phosphatase PAP2 family protein [Chloroflexota bacterium]
MDKVLGRRFQVFFGLLLLSFILFSYSAHTWDRFPGDLALSRWLQGWQPPGMVPLLKVISQVGTRAIALPIVLFVSLALWFWHRRDAIWLLFTLVADVVAEGVKELVARPRPDETLVAVAKGYSTSSYSYPSAHVVHFVAFYGFLFYLAGWLVPDNRARIVVRCFLGALVVLVGVSRVYLGVHWPSDVVGGYLLGGIFLTLWIFLYNKGSQGGAPGQGSKVSSAHADSHWQ